VRHFISARRGRAKATGVNEQQKILCGDSSSIAAANSESGDLTGYHVLLDVKLHGEFVLIRAVPAIDTTRGTDATVA
jgi:hypothetical protein